MADGPQVTRRSVILATGAIGVGRSAAAADNTLADSAERDDPTKVTLRDTDHIRTYYKLARQ